MPGLGIIGPPGYWLAGEPGTVDAGGRTRWSGLAASGRTGGGLAFSETKTIHHFIFQEWS